MWSFYTQVIYVLTDCRANFVGGLPLNWENRPVRPRANSGTSCACSRSLGEGILWSDSWHFSLDMCRFPEGTRGTNTPDCPVLHCHSWARKSWIYSGPPWICREVLHERGMNPVIFAPTISVDMTHFHPETCSFSLGHLIKVWSLYHIFVSFRPVTRTKVNFLKS